MPAKVKKKKLVDSIKSMIQDGWENVYTGLGSSLDKITGHVPSEEMWFTEDTLEAIFQSSPIAQRIITELPDTAFRNGWIPVYNGENDASDTVDDQNRIIELLDGDDASQGLCASHTMLNAIYWGRLYGRGGLLIGANDGGAMDSPLDIERVTEFSYLEDIDSRDFWPLHYYMDPSEQKYGKPEIWALQRQNAGGTMEYTEVHESRIMLFESGIPTSRSKLSEEKWRWQPLVQSLYPTIRAYNSAQMSIANMITDASIAVMKIVGLRDLLASEDITAFSNRMKILTMGRGIRVLPIDDDESYEYIERKFTGMKDIIDHLGAGLAADAGYSQMLLLGNSTSGLSNEDVTADRWWTGKAKAAQSHYGRDMNLIVRIAAHAVGVADPMSWSAGMNDIWQRTPEEDSAHIKAIADADKIYIDTQVLTPEEIAIKRFGAKEFDDGSPQIDIDARQAMIDGDMERMKEGPQEIPDIPDMQNLGLQEEGEQDIIEEDDEI